MPYSVPAETVLEAASIQAKGGGAGIIRRRVARGFATLACAGMLAACTTRPVIPSSEFPKPVLRRIPVTVGLYMDPAFVAYVHHEVPPDGGPKQDVSVGPASKVLFSEFLSAQFANLLVIGQAPTAQSVAPGVQAVLQPVVQEVQISSPKTDKDPFHEAWIKYRLRLLTPQGQEITTWELAAYGKQRGQAVGGTNSALTAAVRDAMRDAAAGMALLFRDGNAFRARLAAATSAPATTATP